MKKLILSVLCTSVALGAFAQKKPDAPKEDPKKALAQWIWDNQWVPCEGDSKGGEPPLAIRFTSSDVSYSDGCNRCSDEIVFDVKNMSLQRTNDLKGPICTLRACPQSSYRDGLHGLSLVTAVRYSREGDRLILTEGVQKVCFQPLPK